MSRSVIAIGLLLSLLAFPVETRKRLLSGETNSNEGYCYNDNRKPFHFNHPEFDCWWRLMLISIISAISSATLVSIVVGSITYHRCSLCYDQLIDDEYPL